MRPSQAVKRQILESKHGRPDPQATRKRVEELLRRVDTAKRRLRRAPERRAPGLPNRRWSRLRDRIVPSRPDELEGSPDAGEPALSGEPVRHADPALQRESQTGDDRVLEAPSVGALSDGDLGRVAELHEGSLGEPAEGDAGTGCRAHEASVGAPGCGPGAAAAGANQPASRMASGLLLRTDRDAGRAELCSASGEVRDLAESRWEGPLAGRVRSRGVQSSVHVSRTEGQRAVMRP